MWDLPGPGLEPVSPALAGRFVITAPPGKPRSSFWRWRRTIFSAGGCGVSPRGCVWSYLEIMWMTLWSWGSARMALLLLPWQALSIEFIWLLMCQKSLVISCSADGRARGFLGGKNPQTLTLQKISFWNFPFLDVTISLVSYNLHGESRRRR